MNDESIKQPPDWEKEMEKCKASPYYYYTTYWLVDGKPGTTNLTEEEFNQQFRELESHGLTRLKRRR